MNVLAASFLLGAFAAGLPAFLLHRAWMARDRATRKEAGEALLGRVRRAEVSRTQIIEELAHDLRTPLTSILTAFENIQDSRDPQFMRECVEVALPEIDYVNRLIDDLFLLAQMQEPSYKPKREAVDLAALLREEAERFSALAGTGGGVRCEFGGEAEARVLADGFLVRRLAKNLVGNAMKFAATRVTVKLESFGGQGIRFSVTDDGPGFPADGDPFGERRPSLKGKTAASSSLGLGSVIARRIVELEGGHIRTFNRLTTAGVVKGAVVEVTLACARAERAKRVA